MGPHVRRLLETIRQHRLDDRSERWAQVRRLGEWDMIAEDMADALILALQPEILQQERRPNFCARAPTYAELYPDNGPDLVLGQLEEVDGVPIGLDFHGPVHSIFPGTTGAGKTIAMRRLTIKIEELNKKANRPVSVIVLDRKGTDYADLPQMLGERWLHFDVHSTLRLGLNNPWGVPENAWINRVATLFCSRAGLIAAWVTLADMMRWLLEVMNRGRSEQLWPDWQLLLDLIRAARARAFSAKTQYDESLTHALEGITKASGELFQTFGGLDLERDIVAQGKSAVLSMPMLDPPWLGHFIIDLLLSQVVLGRMHRGHRVDNVEVIFIIDEADAVVSKKAEAAFSSGMSPISECLRLGREFGIGVCLGVAALGPVARHVLSAAAYHFIFRMKDAECIEEARRTLLLPPGAEAILPALEPGECLVRQSGSWPHAMLARIDEVPPCRNPSPRYDKHAFVPAQRLVDLPDVAEAVKKELSRKNSTEPQKSKHAILRPEARQLLYQASNNPYYPVARLYDLMVRPSPAVQKAIRRELYEAGYATFEEVRVGSKQMLLIELTEQAWALLGKPPIKLAGRGGLAHRCFAAWIEMIGKRRGYAAYREWIVPSSNHAVDVAWKVQDWEVFEIIVSCWVPSHIDAIFSSTYIKRLTIVAPQKAILKSIEKQLAAKLEPFRMLISFTPVEVFEQEIFGKKT